MSLDVRYINHYHISHLINPEKSVKNAKKNPMIQQPGPCYEYAKETRETLPRCFPLQPQPSPQPSPPRATPGSTAAFASLIRWLGLSAHLMFTEKKKHFQRLQAFLSACGNILIAIKEMTTPSLDIIKRWGAFLDTLTGVHAGTWKHVIFIGIYFVVKVMRNIFSGVITI